MLIVLLVLSFLSIVSIKMYESGLGFGNIKILCLGFSILNFIQTYIIMFIFEPNSLQFQFITGSFLGIDGLSLWLIWLIGLLMPILILSLSNLSQLLIINIIGFWSIAVFLVQHLIFFYVSFEGVLIPLYIYIILYGSRNRKIHASYMFFIYTLFGSLFLLLGFISLYILFGTSNYMFLIHSTSKISYSYELIIWVLFFICFAMKLPLIGLHTWLLNAHVESPTAGSVLLAAILLKMGSYGLMRYNISLLPNATNYYRPLVMILSVISIIYSTISALSQIDMKLIIAYSSIGHMATATLGLFSNEILGIQGSIYFLISHGLISSALFLLVGVLYERYHTRTLIYYRGLVQIYPIYITISLFFYMANSAIPLTSGYIAEFLSLLGSFSFNPILCILASSSIVLVPSYMLKLYHNISYGKYSNYLIINYNDLTRKEFNYFISLIFYTFFLGIYPSIVLDEILLYSIHLLHLH